MYPRSAVTCALYVAASLCLCLPRVAVANPVSITFNDLTDTITIPSSGLPANATVTIVTEGIGIAGQAHVSFSYLSTDPNIPTSVFTANYNIYEPLPPPTHITKVIPCIPPTTACFGPLSDTLSIVLTPENLPNANLGVSITFMSDPSDESAVLTSLPNAILMAENGTIQTIQQLSDLSVSFQSDLETPLPAALPLFATGLGAIGLIGWRRKRKVQAV